MMNRNLLITIIFLQITNYVVSQQPNDLTSSPYSLYGLGLFNNINTGKTNSLGKAGIAMPSLTEINNTNPASYATIPKSRFFYDIGFIGQYESLYEGNNKESKFNANFSNLAFAFPLNDKSGLGITLIPFTNVGYYVQGIETGIDGSAETFTSNIEGAGGLNDLQLNYGYSLARNLRIGLSGSLLFGGIDETEMNIVEQTSLSLEEENFYSGFRFGTGVQYEISKNFAVGATIKMPTSLKGSQTKTITTSSGDVISDDNDLDDFKLPSEIGFGISTTLNNNFLLNVDYRKSFWDATNQMDRIGTFQDQDFLGIGLEYIPKKDGLNYFERIAYRAGFNYDNGNITIDNNKIENYNLSLGFGLPIGVASSNSMLNFNYSYGQRGLIENGLIKENYHLVTLNVSLEGIWFLKRILN